MESNILRGMGGSNQPGKYGMHSLKDILNESFRTPENHGAKLCWPRLLGPYIGLGCKGGKIC